MTTENAGKIIKQGKLRHRTFGRHEEYLDGATGSV
jgi:hypothetical protein